MQCYAWSASVALLSMIPGKKQVKNMKKERENGTKKRSRKRENVPGCPSVRVEARDWTTYEKRLWGYGTDVSRRLRLVAGWIHWYWYHLSRGRSSTVHILNYARYVLTPEIRIPRLSWQVGTSTPNISATCEFY